MKKGVAGKTAPVTGVSKGIGRATALAFVAEGADAGVTACEAAIRTLVRIDTLVDNVGIARCASFADLSLADDMRTSFLFTRAFLQPMIIRQGCA